MNDATVEERIPEMCARELATRLWNALRLSAGGDARACTMRKAETKAPVHPPLIRHALEPVWKFPARA